MLRRNVIWFGLLELILVLLLATYALRLWSIDLYVPFNYWGDTLWFLISVKGMINNGWTYDIPQLSAPFYLSLAAFPSMTHLDWGIMKVISFFIDDAGAVLNIFWLFSIVLTAWLAMLALRLLGLGNWLALGLGLVYSFLPFTLWRNTAHINLVFYCVPLLSLFAIHLACDDEQLQSSSIRMVGYLAALAQGLNYIYFSFFAVLLFFFGGWLGYKRKNSWKSLRGAAVASGIVILSSVINLLPSYTSWQEHGKPPNMDFKSPQEAEIYGLKLRKMLVPHEANIIPIFSHWGKRDRSTLFPNENENIAARLGPFAALGFLLLLATSLGLVRSDVVQEVRIIKPIASLTLFSFLVVTVGGFGAIFNQIIGPDIRCYNRFSVFIAFFSIAGLGLWWQSRLKNASSHYAQLALLGGVVLLITFSLYDQLIDAGYLRNRRPSDEQSAHYERQFVRQFEAKLSPGSLVFQLPITGFPDGGKERMLPYDHVRPYLWSSHLRWSWPSFSQRHRNWLMQVADLKGEALVEALVLSKFRAVWVDRFGYSDNGKLTISSLIAAGASDILPGAHPRYVVLDLEPVAAQLRQRLGADEFAQRQAALLEAPIIKWVNGFYAEEYNVAAGKKFRWSQAESMVQIRSPSDTAKSIILAFFVVSGRNGNLTVSTETQQLIVPVTAGKVTPVELPLRLEPNVILNVRFKGDMGRILLPPGEKRDLHFYLMDLHLRIVPPTEYQTRGSGSS
jgi:phosphoglycerol transferase